jgi:hypothetical protein
VQAPREGVAQQTFRLLVGGVLVEDDVDDFAGRYLCLDGVEEAVKSWCQWSCMQRPMKAPSRMLRAANSVVVP